MTTTITGATGIDNIKAATGAVLQVVQGTTSTEVSATSTSYIDTGLTAAITPTSASSKIVVMIQHNDTRVSAAGGSIDFNLYRDGASLSVLCKYYLYNSAGNLHAGFSSNYLDSPASTSSLTYKTVFKRTQNTSTVYVQADNTPSTITLMEIAG